jgi:hypothetical protein
MKFLLEKSTTLLVAPQFTSSVAFGVSLQLVSLQIHRRARRDFFLVVERIS